VSGAYRELNGVRSLQECAERSQKLGDSGKAPAAAPRRAAPRFVWSNNANRSTLMQLLVKSRQDQSLPLEGSFRQY